MATPTASPAVEEQTRRPPAGWYPDPIGSANWLRYWDGSDWTDETALMALRESAAKAVPTDPACDEAPAEVAEEDGVTAGSVPVASPAPSATQASVWWTRGAVLAVSGLVLIAIFLAAHPDNKPTPRAPHKARVSQPAPTPLSVRIISPADGATVHGHSVLIKGVISHSRARVTVNGHATVVGGHRFSVRLPLRLGYNEFDVAAAKAGLEAGMTSVSVVRTRSARERAALLARRVNRRLAAQPGRAAATPEPSTGRAAGTPGTSSGVSAPANGSTPDLGAADGDLKLLPPKTAAPSTAAPTPAPAPAPIAPAVAPQPPATTP